MVKKGKNKHKEPLIRLVSNKNARRLKEAHIAQNFKEIKILDRDGEDLKELDQH